MYAISLTSIPPRLPKIAPVLRSLLCQEPAPTLVYLCLPMAWDRFGELDTPFCPPEAVTLGRSEVDLGPSLKVLGFVRGSLSGFSKLIYCDDDWIYPKGWAHALLSHFEAGAAVAASGFNVDRLKRRRATNDPGYIDIAQGFAGVCVDPNWFALPDAIPPKEARLADDIWLSGHLARTGIKIRECKEARMGLRPAFSDRHGLQDVAANGLTRREVNDTALNVLTQRYGLWPNADA